MLLFTVFSFLNNNLIMTLKLCDYSVNLKRNTEMTQPCSADLFTLPLASLRSYWQELLLMETNHILTCTLSTGLFRFLSTLLFLIFFLCSGEKKKPRNQWVLLLLCVLSSLYVHKLQIMWSNVFKVSQIIPYTPVEHPNNNNYTFKKLL